MDEKSKELAKSRPRKVMEWMWKHLPRKEIAQGMGMPEQHLEEMQQELELPDSDMETAIQVTGWVVAQCAYMQARGMEAELDNESDEFLDDLFKLMLHDFANARTPHHE